MIIKNVIEENIISALKMDELSFEEKAELIEKMTEVINKSVLLRIGQKLDENTRKEFMKVLESGTEDELGDFLSENVPDFLVIIMEETNRVKENVIAHLQK